MYGISFELNLEVLKKEYGNSYLVLMKKLGMSWAMLDLNGHMAVSTSIKAMKIA